MIKIENLLIAIESIFTLNNLFALFSGVVLGVLVGAMPGMTTTMGVALGLPFTFVMNPLTALLFLVGIYKGGTYGGALTAILIKTPGTPGNAPTVFDGYPMAQQGKAGKALNMALYASCTADFISNISLILCAVPLAMLAMKIGPPEYFSIILFALTVVAGVSERSLTRGLMAGALGLLFATVGSDPIYGHSRFIFGIHDLRSGLNQIPVFVGLFAIPEILRNVEKSAFVSSLTRASMSKNKENNILTWQEYKSNLKTIIRGSLIGVIVGALPGLGATTGSFLSYNEARKRSKHPEMFGRGALEGVAASESGNNGVCGAAMIPMLALGVPGDVVTAVMLGAFMIHGLVPGPVLFRENIDIINGLFVGIMVGSVFLFIVGKLATQAFKYVASMNPSVVFPSVLVLCFFGVYAVNNSVFDVKVMVIIGLLTYFLGKMKLPAASFAIAFVLQPLLEEGLRQSLRMSRGSWSIFVTQPISLLFLVITLVTVVGIVLSVNKRKKKSINNSQTA